MVLRSNVTVFLTTLKHIKWWNRQRKAEMKRVQYVTLLLFKMTLMVIMSFQTGMGKLWFVILS